MSEEADKGNDTLEKRVSYVHLSIAARMDVFNEEFIAQGGLSKLVQLLRYPKWQI